MSSLKWYMRLGLLLKSDLNTNGFEWSTGVGDSVEERVHGISYTKKNFKMLHGN